MGEVESKSRTSYLLCFSFLGPEKSRGRAASEVEELVRNTTRFRVADVAGKVSLRLDAGDLIVVFFDDSDAPLECAVAIAHELNSHPDVHLRTGICSGPVDWDSQLDWRSNVTRKTMDFARRLTDIGDSGHILISKRLAYELASNPRWDEHMYELEEFGTRTGRISAVTFYTNEIGNPEAPRKIYRQRSHVERSVKFKPVRHFASITAIVIILAALTAGGYVFVRRALNVPAIATPAVERTILLLPFLDMSPARDQEYLSDGISEEILDRVAGLRNVRVIGRASAFSFKTKNFDWKEIARRLGAQIVIQGNVRRDGEWIRIAAEILNAQNYAQVWSETFERDVREVPLIENEVATAAARAIGAGAPSVVSANGWSDPLTNDLYLQGLFLSHKTNDDDLESSLDFFRLALDKNPKLSRAWSGTAKDLIELTQRGGLRPRDAYWRAQEAAKSALTLDPHDAGARVCLGETKRVLSWDLAGDETELNRAFSINPNCVAAHLAAAALKQWLGLPNESLPHVQAALRLDPLSPLAGHLEVMFNLVNDRLNDAGAAAQQLMESDPSYSFFEQDLALTYREQGKLDQALDVYLRLAATRPQPGVAITFARLNRVDDAQKAVNDLIEHANREYFPADKIAAVFVALGENDEAFRWLDRAVEEHSVSVHNLGCGRDFRPLRRDPRYPRLLRRIGLDPNRFLR